VDFLDVLVLRYDRGAATLGEGVGETVGVGVGVGVVVGAAVGVPIGCSNVPSSGTRSTHVARHTRPVNVVTTAHR
jgi:hypothetical protein